MTTLAWIIVLICVAVTCYGLGCGAGEEHEQKKPKEPYLIQMGDTWPQMQVQNNLRAQIRDLQAENEQLRLNQEESDRRFKKWVDKSRECAKIWAENANLEYQNKDLLKKVECLNDAVDKATETIQAQMVEIKELRADIQERYEQSKEVHVWVKDQALDFNNLRDVAVKLEQENERLREKLGMDSLAPSAKNPAPEPNTKPNI